MTTARNRTEPPVNRRLGFEAAPYIKCSTFSTFKAQVAVSYHVKVVFTLEKSMIVKISSSGSEMQCTVQELQISNYMKYKILEIGKYKSTNTVRKILCKTVTIFIVTVKMYLKCY